MTSLLNRMIVGAAAVIALNVTAEAADLRVRGEVVKLDGAIVAVASAAGQITEVNMPEQVVLMYRDIPLEDIKDGDYVAIPSIAAADGTRKALGLVKFPDAMRGMNEGFKGWDLTPESKMTNATVATIVSNTADQVLTVKFGDEEQIVNVPGTAQVSTFAPAQGTSLEVGMNVVIFANDDSGQIAGKFVGIHENGGLPPL